MKINIKKQLPTIFKLKDWLVLLTVSEKITFISVVIAVFAFVEARVTAAEMAELTRSVSIYESKKSFFESRINVAMHEKVISCIAKNAGISLTSGQQSVLNVFSVDVKNMINDKKFINSNNFNSSKDYYDFAAINYENRVVSMYGSVMEIIQDLKVRVPVEDLQRINTICSL